MRAVDLHYTDSGGTGEAVLLAHALGCDHRMWEEMATRLEEALPRRRLRYARARSQPPLASPPLHARDPLADDARALLDKLQASARRTGSAVPRRHGRAGFRVRHPARLLKLVIANSTASYGADGRATWQARVKMVQEGGLAAIRDASASRWFSEGFRSSHPQQVERYHAALPERPWRATWAAATPSPTSTTPTTSSASRRRRW